MRKLAPFLIGLVLLVGANATVYSQDQTKEQKKADQEKKQDQKKLTAARQNEIA